VRFSVLSVLACAIPLPLAATPDADSIADYTIYVSNERSGEVSVIDGRSQTVVATWQVGKRPRGIHLGNDGETLFVALSGSPRLGPGVDAERAKSLKADRAADGIALVDPRSGAVRRKLAVGSDPEEFALSRDGRMLFVSNEDEATASGWEIATGKMTFTAHVSEEPEGVALHPIRPEIYVTCEEKGDVFILDAKSGKVRARLPVGGRPRTISFSRDAAHAFIPIEGKAEVAVIDTAAHRVVSTISIPGAGVLPMDSVVSADGRELFVSTGRGNSIAVLDLATRECVASISVGERPWGIGLSPGGRTLFTANGGSNDVSVVDPAARREIKRIRVGDGPWGIAIGLRR
jgi:YVTN family beta-propeller protein